MEEKNIVPAMQDIDKNGITNNYALGGVETGIYLKGMRSPAATLLIDSQSNQHRIFDVLYELYSIDFYPGCLRPALIYFLQ